MFVVDTDMSLPLVAVRVPRTSPLSLNAAWVARKVQHPSGVLQEYDAVLKAVLVLRCRNQKVVQLHIDPPAAALGENMSFKCLSELTGTCVLFSAYKIRLFYIAGSKGRGAWSEMSSWVQALYSTLCSWELFIWRQAMASNIIVSKRFFLQKASFPFLVATSKPATVGCCCTTPLKTDAHILSNASALFSSYSAFLMFTASDKPPPRTDHKLFVVNRSQSKLHQELTAHPSTLKWG